MRTSCKESWKLRLRREKHGPSFILWSTWGGWFLLKTVRKSLLCASLPAPVASGIPECSSCITTLSSFCACPCVQMIPLYKDVNPIASVPTLRSSFSLTTSVKTSFQIDYFLSYWQTATLWWERIQFNPSKRLSRVVTIRRRKKVVVVKADWQRIQGVLEGN